MPTLAVSPSWLPRNATRTVTFIGIDTEWTEEAPEFTPDGVDDVEIGEVTVVSDLVATAEVTTGEETGVVTWTDSTTDEEARQNVGHVPPKWIGRRR